MPRKRRKNVKESEPSRGMGRKGDIKSKKTSADDKLKDEVSAILFIAFGIFLAISLQTEAAGKIGNFIEMSLKGCFAGTAYILPYYLIIYGVLLFLGKAVHIGKKSLLLLTIIFLCLTVLNCALFYSKSLNNAISFNHIKDIFRISANLQSGGAIGMTLSRCLFKAVGEAGTYIFTVAAMTVSLLLIVNTPIADIFRRLFKKKNKKGDEDDSKAQYADAENFKEFDEPEKRGELKEKSKISDFIFENKTFKERQMKILDYMKDDELFSKKEDSPGFETHENKPSEDKKPEAVKVPEKEEEIKISIADNSANYKLPSLELLNKPAHHHNNNHEETLRAKAELLEKTLFNFGVNARVVQVSKGPTVTRYEIQPDTGVKVSSIVRLSDDIALNLKASSIRIEAPIPGKAAIGIEVQNDRITPVTIREVLESHEFKHSKSKLSFAVGKDISGNTVIADLRQMPHLLIAGSTGSGKSVCINSIIASLLFKAKPDEVKLLLIDPKVVELNQYNGIPHLLIPVVTDPNKAAAALNWAVQEMTGRYKMFAEENVRDLNSYNNKMQAENRETMPLIVIIIDELADLMMAAPSQVEESICRLAQMARAAGMHLIVATQRPSVDVITGVIKANIPSRIAFAVSSQIDSRTILDMAGAEKLAGKGDMLFNPLGMPKPVRIQGALISDPEVERVIGAVKSQNDKGEYSDDIIQSIESVKTDFGEEATDDLLKSAIEVVVNAEQASVSMLQRRFRIGYNRAARLIDMMEERGIVGPFDGSRPRRVLITKEELEELTEA